MAAVNIKFDHNNSKSNNNKHYNEDNNKTSENWEVIHDVDLEEDDEVDFSIEFNNILIHFEKIEYDLLKRLVKGDKYPNDNNNDIEKLIKLLFSIQNIQLQTSQNGNESLVNSTNGQTILAKEILDKIQTNRDHTKNPAKGIEAVHAFLEKQSSYYANEIYKKLYQNMDDARSKANKATGRDPRVCRFLLLNNMCIFTIIAGVASFSIVMEVTSPWPSEQSAIKGNALMLSVIPAFIGAIFSGLMIDSIPNKEERMQERIRFEQKVKSRYDLAFEREITFFQNFNLGTELCSRSCYADTLKRLLFSYVEAFGGYFRFLVKVGISIYCIPPEHWIINEQGKKECTTGSNGYFIRYFIVPAAVGSCSYFALNIISPLTKKNWLKQGYKNGASTYIENIIKIIGNFTFRYVDPTLKLFLYIGVVDSLEAVCFSIAEQINPSLVPLQYGYSFFISVPLGIVLFCGEKLATKNNGNCACGCCTFCEHYCGLEPEGIFQTTVLSSLSVSLLYVLADTLMELYNEGDQFAFTVSLISYIVLLIVGMGSTVYSIDNSVEDEELVANRMNIHTWMGERISELTYQITNGTKPLVENMIQSNMDKSHADIFCDSDSEELGILLKSQSLNKVPLKNDIKEERETHIIGAALIESALKEKWEKSKRVQLQLETTETLISERIRKLNFDFEATQIATSMNEASCVSSPNSLTFGQPIQSRQNRNRISATAVSRPLQDIKSINS